MLDAVELLRRRSAHHSVHVVALVEQQLGEIRPVLTGDAGDQCAGHRESFLRWLVARRANLALANRSARRGLVASGAMAVPLFDTSTPLAAIDAEIRAKVTAILDA